MERTASRSPGRKLSNFPCLDKVQRHERAIGRSPFLQRKLPVARVFLLVSLGTAATSQRGTIGLSLSLSLEPSSSSSIIPVLIAVFQFIPRGFCSSASQSAAENLPRKRESWPPGFAFLSSTNSCAYVGFFETWVSSHWSCNSAAALIKRCQVDKIK